MPLTQSSSDEIRRKNYKKLRREGYDEDQAWAIAYNIQREAEGNNGNNKKKKKDRKK